MVILDNNLAEMFFTYHNSFLVWYIPRDKEVSCAFHAALHLGLVSSQCYTIISIWGH